MNVKIEKIFSVSVLLALGIFILYTFFTAFLRVSTPDFNPINGDYQTYNGIRHLLNGHIPFKDFYYYLGLGPLYISTALTAIFGGTFLSSLFAMHLQPIFLFGGFYCLFGFFEKNRAIKVAVSLFLTALSRDLLYVDNSMRFWRIYVTIPSALIFFSTLNPQKSAMIRGLLLAAGCGILSVWSTDYGSTLLPIYPSFFILYLLFQEKINIWNAVKISVMMLCVIILSHITAISILTVGNYKEWLSYTLGIASMQSWYFNPELSPASVGILLKRFATDTHLLISCFFLAFFLFFSFFNIKKMSNLFLDSPLKIHAFTLERSFNKKSYGMLALLAHIFLGLLFYVYSNVHYTPQSIMLMRLLVLGFIIFTVFQLINHTKVILILMMLICCAAYIKKIDIPDTLNQLSQTFSQGITYGYQKDTDAIQKITAGNTVFSTYATAFEDRTKTFNPSRIDYVIHALGDKYISRYSNTFISSPPQFVIDPVPNNNWNIWIWKANFFIYEYIFTHYKPVFISEYGTLWERSPQPNNFPLEPKSIQILNNGSTHVTIQVDLGKELPKDFPYYMGVLSLSYHSKEQRMLWYHQNLKKRTQIDDGWFLAISNQSFLQYTGERISRRTAETNWHYPIKINHNGIGTIQLYSFGRDIYIDKCQYVTTIKDYNSVKELLIGQNDKTDIDDLLQKMGSKIKNPEALLEYFNISETENNLLLPFSADTFEPNAKLFIQYLIHQPNTASTGASFDFMGKTWFYKLAPGHGYTNTNMVFHIPSD